MLRMIRKYYPHFQARGATVVAISPQSVEANRKLQEDIGLDFPILSDTHCQYAKMYNIVFEVSEVVQKILTAIPEANKNDSWEIPIPATYVIQPNGSISYSFVDVDYSKRAEPIDILHELPPLPKNRRLSLSHKLKFQLSRVRDEHSDEDMKQMYRFLAKVADGPRESNPTLDKGVIAPDFSLQSHDGTVFRSKKQSGPLVISFYHGEWSSFDILALQHLEIYHKKIQRLGGRLIGISSQTGEASLRTATATGVSFPLLRDTQGKTARKFGVDFEVTNEELDDCKPLFRNATASLRAQQSNGKYILPMISTFIVDGGTIVYTHCSTNPADRTEPREILTVLSEISQKEDDLKVLDGTSHLKSKIKASKGIFSLNLKRWTTRPSKSKLSDTSLMAPARRRSRLLKGW